MCLRLAVVIVIKQLVEKLHGVARIVRAEILNLASDERTSPPAFVCNDEVRLKDGKVEFVEHSKIYKSIVVLLPLCVSSVRHLAGLGDQLIY